jgi:pantothenate synthetase
VDYVEVLLPDTFDRPLRVEAGTALSAAVRAGKARLIDNVLLLDAEAAEREDSSER